MEENLLEQLIREHLEGFQQHSPVNVGYMHEAIAAWDKNKNNSSLLTWWKEQQPSWIAAFQSYVFWMWTTGKIEYQLFDTVYYTLTPVSGAWCVPIVMTTGMDDPVFEGGFVSHSFSVFQYDFSPSSRHIEVRCPEHPQPSTSCIYLDTILDFLSLYLAKEEVGYLGFRQIQSQKTRSWTTALVGGMMGPEIQTLPDFDFEFVQKALLRIAFQENNEANSLTQLLHVRHRAILDSNTESKLITLWSFLEEQWGEDDKQDRLLTTKERTSVKQALAFLPQEKFSKVMDQIGKLKDKTINDKIIEEVEKLECSRGANTRRIVRDIHSLRSRFAHGGAMGPGDQEKTNQYITFMLQIIDELITRKLAAYGVKFS